MCGKLEALRFVERMDGAFHFVEINKCTHDYITQMEVNSNSGSL